MCIGGWGGRPSSLKKGGVAQRGFLPLCLCFELPSRQPPSREITPQRLTSELPHVLPFHTPSRIHAPLRLMYPPNLSERLRPPPSALNRKGPAPATASAPVAVVHPPPSLREWGTTAAAVPFRDRVSLSLYDMCAFRRSGRADWTGRDSQLTEKFYA